MSNYIINYIIPFILLFIIILIMIISLGFIFKFYIIKSKKIIYKIFFITIIDIIISVNIYNIINYLLNNINEFILFPVNYIMLYIFLILINFLFIYKIFIEELYRNFKLNTAQIKKLLRTYINIFLTFIILTLSLYWYKDNVNIIKHYIDTNNFLQLLIFFFVIVFINKIIWFLIFNRLANVYKHIILFIIYIILISHSLIILSLIWNEIKDNELWREYTYYLSSYLFLLWLQWFSIFNISRYNFKLSEFHHMYSKTYKIFVFIITIFYIFLMNSKNIVIKFSLIFAVITSFLYYILKYNIEMKLYNIILFYLSPYMHIYYYISYWYIMILFSLICTKLIYDQFYEKIYEMTYPNINFSRDFRGQLFLFLFYFTLISIIIIYNIFGDILLDINLNHFGIFLDLMDYIIKSIIKLTILLFKYILISIRILISFFEILIDFIKNAKW